ncbi:hypothetical protein [Pontimicrobium sp. MEBiC01747]
MKTNKSNIVYTNSDADNYITKQLPIITQKVTTNAVDLAVKGLPNKEDSLKVYILMIHALFQSLLEDVHKLLGAKRIIAEKEIIEENYAKEEAMLSEKSEALEEDLRVLKKQEKDYNNNLKHIIRNWRIALFFLVLLSFSETMLNFKIFLPISSNNLTALLGALGIAMSFFIITHVFKDILNFFETRLMKWLIGLGIVSLITSLLYSFAKLRLAYNASSGATGGTAVSEWNFVILNLTLFLAGLALTLIYKPSKKLVADYNKHKIIANQIKAKSKEYNQATARLAVMLEEKNEKLTELDGILLMAHHYETSISAEYIKAFALWCNHNLISRKDKVNPDCFSETPTPLTTYFDTVEFQTTNTKTI